MDVDEKFRVYMDINGFHNFEGSRGVDRVEKIAADIGGYRDIREFLADNSGACDALVEFIQEWTGHNREWEQSLDAQLGDYDSEEDGVDHARLWSDTSAELL